MVRIQLNGTWSLSCPEGDVHIAAQVPGCVHTDLIAAEKIPDPWFRNNESKIHWVWERDWIYERAFEVTEDFLGRPNVILQCHGLDTLACVEVNGTTVLRADNMHRTWEADVKKVLHAGTNTIRITFTSPREIMKQGDANRHIPAWVLYHEDFLGRSYIRKMACAFGWDWGIMAPTAGIWRGIGIIGYEGRIGGLRIGQEHSEGRVTLHISGSIEGSGDHVSMTVNREGHQVALAVPPIGKGAFSAEVIIENPELWWPNGLGKQPLYEVIVSLSNAHAAATLDTIQRRIGLRTLQLIREKDEYGESFAFCANGRNFFAKGANWIPADIFPSRIADDTYAHLLRSAADSHMNMIRVWGGGIYEDDRFYDLCDELGVLVWQDFMFACAAYPGYDDAFCENVKLEAIDNVVRLRHRPCLALWCGNNELEQGFVNWEEDVWTKDKMSLTDYKKLFDHLLADVVREHDGITPYWPSSSHTPGSNRANYNDDTIGDAHSWSVWFGGQSFEAQRGWKFRFMSEFGFQSFPEPRTVESFTDPQDRYLNSWVMDYHQRSGNGNGTIFRYLIDWFLPPASFDDTLWMTQISQALCVQYATEHARRIQGRMDGLLYWQLNDLWPGATWSSIDVFGRWKALQFFAKRFFAPVIVSIAESNEKENAELHVSNHQLETIDAVLQWEITDCRGESIRSGKTTVNVDSQRNAHVLTLDLADLRVDSPQLPLNIGNSPRPREADRDLLVWARLEKGGQEISRNLAFLAKPKYLLLQMPDVKVVVDHVDGVVAQLTITTDVPAPWTQLEICGIDGDFSDNFIHLHPRHPSRVNLRTLEPLDRGAILSAVKAVPLLRRSRAC